MDSRTFTAQQMYQDRRQYRVPFYQRPYVWNKNDQWERLWDDIRDKAESRLQGDKAVPHFMGAVVLEPQKKVGLLGVERHHIIDGQQRLTTMQYVLNAMAHALRKWEQPKFQPIIEACLYNANPETMEEHEVERFKLWPTFRDRDHYVQAMTAASIDELRERFPSSFTRTGSLRKIGIKHPPALEAIVFFHDAMIDWVNENSDAGIANLAMALTSAVMTDLSIVCISLREDDDAQVIFETLNGHGAELHATDLIRNFIFMRANANADDLYTNLWSQLGTGDTAIGVFGRRISIWDASPSHALASQLTPEAFGAALAEATGDASRWPRDEEFRKHWLEGSIYPRRLDAAKLRAVFHRLETAMRSEKSEERVPLALNTLDIDHILPQAWSTYWPLSEGEAVTSGEIRQAKLLQFVPDNLDERSKAILEREAAVPRLGNLTLVHYGVNRALQNHAFEEKRRALFDHSHLQLNRELMQKESWDEAAISERGEQLFQFARAIWHAPV
ncbi:MAG: DUF262 domain-containing HNH endonuclease family protein [Thiohalobacteraceae bacterium]